MPAENSAKAYLETQVLTASPEQLRLMLLDGAIKFARQGRDALARKDFEGSHHGLSRCRAILVELVSSMRPDVDPDLCAKMSGLYMFMHRELIEAGIEKSPQRVEKVIELIEFDRQTWVMLMEQLAAEKHTATRYAANAELAAQAAPPPGYAGLSLNG